MKKYRWVFLGVFLFSIFLANQMDREIIKNCGIFNSYFIEQYYYSTLSAETLFVRIFVLRMRFLFMIFLVGKVLNGKAFAILLGCFFTAIGGFLCVIAVCNFGVKGMVLILAGGFPQWIFYLLSVGIFLSLCLDQGKRNSSFAKTHQKSRIINFRNEMYGLFFAIFLIGILSESYLNPVILKKFIEIF